MEINCPSSRNILAVLIKTLNNIVCFPIFVLNNVKPILISSGLLKWRSTFFQSTLVKKTAWHDLSFALEKTIGNQHFRRLSLLRTVCLRLIITLLFKFLFPENQNFWNKSVYEKEMTMKGKLAIINIQYLTDISKNYNWFKLREHSNH